MGNTVRHMNLYALATIVQAEEIDILNVLRVYEGRTIESSIIFAPQVLENYDSTFAAWKKKYELNIKRLHDEDDEISASPLPVDDHSIHVGDNAIDISCVDYGIARDATRLLLSSPQIGLHPSDIDTAMTVYTLIDKRGLGDTVGIDLRELMLTFSMLTSKSVHRCISIAFEIMDRQQTQLIDKALFLRMLTLMNEACLYFGDKHLHPQQVQDLVDSVYTLAGKIDGIINYVDYVDSLVEHPILEMFLSPQFQGLGRDKILDEEALESAEMVVR